MDDDKFNGKLHVFSEDLLTDTDRQGIPSLDQDAFPSGRPGKMQNNESNYYNSLIELSKPIDMGAEGINS